MQNRRESKAKKKNTLHKFDDGSVEAVDSAPLARERQRILHLYLVAIESMCILPVRYIIAVQAVLGTYCRMIRVGWRDECGVADVMEVTVCARGEVSTHLGINHPNINRRMGLLHSRE